MNIHTLIEPKTILADLVVSSKEDLLNKMIGTLESSVSKSQLEDIRRAVFEREKIMSTGVGKNLAIPHGKVSSVDEHLACFAILKNPIDFDSIDDKPIDMAFLLIGPEKKNSAHIKLLSRISRLMNNSSFRITLSNCTTVDEIHKAFKKEEISYFGN
ncbi:MAG: PTS sugar transporter subunit IIA [Balneolaceae bacterium]